MCQEYYLCNLVNSVLKHKLKQENYALNVDIVTILSSIVTVIIVGKKNIRQREDVDFSA